MRYKLTPLLVTSICANVLLFLLWKSKILINVRKMYNYNYKNIIKQYADPNDLTVEFVASRLALLWTRDVVNRCTKSKRIYYAKPPKTGSTTLRWVLYSFALRNKLQVCTDKVDLWHMNFPYKIDPENVMGTEHGCDIIADEMVFDKEILEKFAGTTSSDPVKFLTSVREPTRHFLSVYNYANVPNVAGLS